MLNRSFLGSVAIARGLVTRAQLRGPRFRRLYRDVYVVATADVDLALLSEPRSSSPGGSACSGGWSAAELLEASCGPPDAPAEIIVPGRRRTQPRLRVREEPLPESEITTVDGMRVTTALRPWWVAAQVRAELRRRGAVAA